jgi:hypothetical protein
LRPEEGLEPAGFQQIEVGAACHARGVQFWSLCTISIDTAEEAPRMPLSVLNTCGALSL